MGELESRLRKSAAKKGLSGKEEKEYVGGTITNMRKKGQLPKRAKKAVAAKKPRATRAKAAPAPRMKRIIVHRPTPIKDRKVAEAKKKKAAYTKPSLTRHKAKETDRELAAKHLASPLPKLKGGPEKQRDFAEKIRATWYAQAKRNAENGSIPRHELREYIKMHDQTSAIEWIENRPGANYGSFRYAGRHPGSR